MRPAFKFEECRTPRSTGTKKDEERGEGRREKEGGWGTIGGLAAAEGEKYSLWCELGWKKSHPRQNERTEEKKKDSAEYENHRERRSRGKRRKMSETEERLVSDNTAENARAGD